MVKQDADETFSVPPGLPGIETEELPLAQVVRNLVGNAVKHHPGPDGGVVVGFREWETAWEFTVSNDGAGINPRYHQRIFEVFQTLKSWDEGLGTGIGLALVKPATADQIIEAAAAAGVELVVGSEPDSAPR